MEAKSSSWGGEGAKTPHVAELSDEDVLFFHGLPGGDKILGVVEHGDADELSFSTVLGRFRRITKEREAVEAQQQEGQE